MENMGSLWILVSSCHYLPPFYQVEPMIGLSAWGFCWSSWEVLFFHFRAAFGWIWLFSSFQSPQFAACDPMLRKVHLCPGPLWCYLCCLHPRLFLLQVLGSVLFCASSLSCSTVGSVWCRFVACSCTGPKIALTSLMGCLELVLFGKVSKVRLQC